MQCVPAERTKHPCERLVTRMGIAFSTQRKRWCHAHACVCIYLLILILCICKSRIHLFACCFGHMIYMYRHYRHWLQATAAAKHVFTRHLYTVHTCVMLHILDKVVPQEPDLCFSCPKHLRRCQCSQWTLKVPSTENGLRWPETAQAISTITTTPSHENSNTTPTKHNYSKDTLYNMVFPYRTLMLM